MLTLNASVKRSICSLTSRLNLKTLIRHMCVQYEQNTQGKFSVLILILILLGGKKGMSPLTTRLKICSQVCAFSLRYSK